tara:strand:- start:393 stop:545 length:153 start_codon:yes stop_codon:yes gene_type:complete
VNNAELEKLKVKHIILKETIITTGFRKLTSSNIEKIRKLNNLEKEIHKWK